jgi:hypothetical protein
VGLAGRMLAAAGGVAKLLWSGCLLLFTPQQLVLCIQR